MRSAECGLRNCWESSIPGVGRWLDTRAVHSALPIPHSALSLEDAEREILPRVRLDVRQELPQLDHREGGLAIQGRVRHQQAERPAAVRDARHQDRKSTRLNSSHGYI